MSKYTEIREVLKEDIAEIVELTFKHRLEGVVGAIMPAILNTVADSIKIHDYTTGSMQNSLHFTMEHLDPGTYVQTTKQIGNPVQIVNPYHIQQLTNKINQLEGELYHVKQQLNANSHTETAP